MNPRRSETVPELVYEDESVKLWCGDASRWMHTKPKASEEA